MRRVETQSQGLETIGFDRRDLVGATHVMPELEQKRGDAAHPAPRHPDEMNPVMLAGEELSQIDFRGERHDWVGCIFPSLLRRGWLRFSEPDGRNFPTFDGV